MAQPVKINLTLIGAAAGALLACGALGGAGLAFLDWRIIAVVEKRERDRELAALCAENLEEVREDKAEYIIRAREALGGCG